MKEVKFILLNALLSIFYAPFLFGYGALSDFISADGSHYRNVMNGETVQSTDLIVDPKWDSASFPLQFTLCTNLASSNVKYQTSKTSELLSDISTAQNAWGFGTGSALSFISPNSSGSCATGGAFDTSHRMIYFDSSLSAGVLAYTPITIVAQAGKLVIVDADIIFNTSTAFQYRTHDCDTASSPSGSCSGGTFPMTFLGILTHEMGHAIGISHSMINDDNASDGQQTRVTMYPSVSDISESRNNEILKLDDQNARENLYPQTNFSSSTGSISGRVMRNASLGNRGAHISIFNLTTKRTITGTYTSMSGSEKNADGTFRVNGIPFNTDIAVFVEPVDRSADGLSTSYANINIPLDDALFDELTGFRAFKIEAYPDVSIPDIRLTGDSTASPGFTNAQQYRLTSANPTVTNLIFYLSQSKAAPNDASLATITFNSNSTITNSNPLKVSLKNPTGLNLLSTSRASLTATSGDKSFDWSKALAAFTLTDTSSTVQVDRTVIDVPDGTYTVTAKLTDSKYGLIVGAQKITVSNWTSNDATSGTTTSDSSSSSGCAIGHTSPSESKVTILMGLFFIAGILFYRKSFTSRDSILSKPKQS